MFETICWSVSSLLSVTKIERKKCSFSIEYRLSGGEILVSLDDKITSISSRANVIYQLTSVVRGFFSCFLKERALDLVIESLQKQGNEVGAHLFTSII